MPSWGQDFDLFSQAEVYFVRSVCWQQNESFLFLYLKQDSYKFTFSKDVRDVR